MKTYKISQNNVPPQELNKILNSIFSLLPGHRFRSPNHPILKDYIEQPFYDNAGQAWIQIRFDQIKQQIAIEKYYDNELAADEYNTTVYLNLDVNNPANTLNQIKEIILSWKGH